ncbi:MAG: hypothetical protein HC851_00770 [Acaryochloris sp. RU_4_1]|nr:hypothetical protein [Acaryochloris sp. RU_4_1]NJR53580.1 hypothetical protein [Acaryochloris sp. CRU_2_0]
MKTKLLAAVTLATLLSLSGTFYETRTFSQETTQKKNTVETKGRLVPSGSRSVKSLQRSVNNDLQDKTPAPPKKGGPRGRQLFSSALLFDNRTPWYIELYVNGIYKGEIGPYGDTYISTTGGSFSLYGIARFRDGSSNTWGPLPVYLGSGNTFTWKLYK